MPLLCTHSAEAPYFKPCMLSWLLTLLSCCADIPAMRQMYIDYYSNNSFDVMCMPTTPSTAPPIYSVEPYMLFRGQYLPNRVSLL